MTRAAFAPLIGAEFGPFLFASVVDDPNGKMLSVLSAFARTDVDPWQEAACLAKMPREKATFRLAAFISTIPDRPGADIPAETIAGRLVALLPKMENSAPQASGEMSKILTSSNSCFGLGFSAIALLIVLALIALAEPRLQPQLSAEPAAPVANSATPLLAIGPIGH